MKLALASITIVSLVLAAGLPELTPLDMVLWAGLGCFCGGAASALRQSKKWPGWYLVFRVACWTGVFGPAFCFATLYFHDQKPEVAWSILGTAVLSSLWGYSAFDVLRERFGDRMGRK